MSDDGYFGMHDSSVIAAVVDVHGIDLSRAMAARMREKPGCDQIVERWQDLVERWQDWDGTPFTHESTRHISIWRKP